MLRKAVMFQFLILIIIYLQNESFAAVVQRVGCELLVNEHLSDPQPLLILQNDAVTDIEAFVLPEDEEGTLTFKKGETIDIACPGGKVFIGETSTEEDVVEAACSSGIKFTLAGKTVPFTDIKCSKIPSHTARYTGKKCASKHKEIEIGFEIKDRFITHIITCYDEDLQNALYAVSYLLFNIGGSQVNFPRPDFQVGDFYYARPNVDYLYSKKGQTETINGILGLDADDPSVIHPTSNVYLATGHYTPKADFVYGAQQRLTFYYVNAAPQWQNFNGGNWNTMERNYRSLAIERQLDFTIYTGTHGIATLPDINGDEQELYLWVGEDNERGIPIPALFYKVVYEPESQAGIALVSINNPHKEIDETDIICEDVCDKISWLTWKPQNPDLGIAYCCEVNEFRKYVKELPKFTVKSLLT